MAGPKPPPRMPINPGAIHCWVNSKEFSCLQRYFSQGDRTKALIEAVIGLCLHSLAYIFAFLCCTKFKSFLKLLFHMVFILFYLT